MSTRSLLESYAVVICQKCGFGYTNNITDRSVFDAYYQEENINYFTGLNY
jgi:hypothetical protein